MQRRTEGHREVSYENHNNESIPHALFIRHICMNRQRSPFQRVDDVLGILRGSIEIGIGDDDGSSLQ